MLGFEVDEPIERVVARLVEKGVRMTGEIIRQENVGNFAAIEDLDGNPIYLWEVLADNEVPESDASLTGVAVR